MVVDSSSPAGGPSTVRRRPLRDRPADERRRRRARRVARETLDFARRAGLGITLRRCATAAILPVKRFGAAKQRLSASAGGRPPAPRSPQAMFADVLAALAARRGRSTAIFVVSGEPDGAELRAASWSLIDDPRRAGSVARPRWPGWRAPPRWATSGRCWCPATARCSIRASSTLLVRGSGGGRGDRARPPRHRHQRARCSTRAGPSSRASARARWSATSSRHTSGACGSSVSEVPSLALDVDTRDDLDRAARGARQRARPRAAHPRRAESDRAHEHSPPLECRGALGARSLAGLPEVHAGDDLAAMIAEAAGTEIGDGDVVVVARKSCPSRRDAWWRCATCSRRQRRASCGRARQGRAARAGDPRREHARSCAPSAAC